MKTLPRIDTTADCAPIVLQLTRNTSGLFRARLDLALERGGSFVGVVPCFVRYLARTAQRYTAGRADRGPRCAVISARFHAIMNSPRLLDPLIADTTPGLYAAVLRDLARALRTQSFDGVLEAVAVTAGARRAAFFHEAAERFVLLVERAPLRDGRRERPMISRRHPERGV